jgi:hypothetical protein
VKDIDVGVSLDQMLLASNGKIYIRERLGGSKIFVFDQSAATFSTIKNTWHDPAGIRLWPTGMALSSDEKELYLLAHYKPGVDIINTTTNGVVARIDLTTAVYPRTDAISEMVYYKTGKKVIGAWPELGIIGAFDMVARSQAATLDITVSPYNFNKVAAANGGPKQITLSIDETSKVLSANFSVSGGARQTFCFDPDTLAVKSCSASQTKIIDPNTNREYRITSALAVPNVPGDKKTTVTEYYNNVATGRSWVLDTVVSGLDPSIVFDFPNKVFYAAYFDTGLVKKYSLF